MTTNAVHCDSSLAAKIEELMRTWSQLSPMERKIGLMAAQHLAIRKLGGVNGVLNAQ